ncbi:MAG: GMC family oxidoreductase [Thermoleophilaceae bacterium]|nr:GMC family oxidoreductase [Thermoleophilaceae bacterium]
MTAEEHFDAVVVGSGFGGAVVALRLAEAGLSVCVLERGKPYPPNSFPRSPHGLAKNFWDPSEGLYGMFNPWSFRGLEALVSSGLGGGSLIYANVLIRKDEDWFVENDHEVGGLRPWPVTRADLDPHYDEVERMLDAQRYPLENAPFDATPKTIAFREAATSLGLDHELPKLAVSFRGPGEEPGVGRPIHERPDRPNLHGQPRLTCRLTGECDFGCNYGSKNSLDYNYLTEAHHAGADIRTLSEVRSFAPRAEAGYTIRYVEHHPEWAAEGAPPPAPVPRTLTARRLVLAAGTLGTTYLLLRNRSALPGLSSALGTRFSGNGDLLTFATRCTTVAGGKRRPRRIDPGRGPVITSRVRVPDALDGGGATGRGFYLEDAGYPEIVNWLVETFDTPGRLWRFRSTLRRLVREYLQRDPDSDLAGEVSGFLGAAVLSDTTLPLLAMGRDIPDGRMRLRGRHGRLDVDWTKETSEAFFARIRDTASDLAQALGGGLADNPLWHLGRVITVHPLGGCPMADTERDGVVNSFGEVYGHPDLVVADGSVMPGPVGPNPSLTIAALAERFAQQMVEQGTSGGA